MNDTHEPQFKMLFEIEWDEVFTFLRSRAISLQDFAVLMALVRQTNHVTGTVRLTLTGLGETIGMKQPHVSASVARLRSHFLVVRGRNPDGGHFVMVNPYLYSSRQKKYQQRLAKHWAKFREIRDC
ncbi:MAG: MarR family transcriptional regulator [Synechococcaceae cyanobacterium]|jgi:DNA-binding MarR family transcriptional regulator